MAQVRSERFMARAMSAWADTVYRVALTRLRSPHDAEDVTQDVFVRLLRDTTQFADGEHLKAWLITVAVNRCREVSRSAWTRRTVPAGNLSAAGSAADALAANASGARNGTQAASVPGSTPGAPLAEPGPEEAALAAHPVWDALAALPDDMRTAVHLHYLEGYSTNEVASLMSSKPATVRSWLHRARKHMKAYLEKEPRHDQTAGRIPQPHAERAPERRGAHAH